MMDVYDPSLVEDIVNYTKDSDLQKQKERLDRQFKQAMGVAAMYGRGAAEKLLRTCHRAEAEYWQALVREKDRRESRTFLNKIMYSTPLFGMSDRMFASLVAISSAQYRRQSSSIISSKKDLNAISTSDMSKKTFACYVGTVIPQKQKSLSLYYYVNKQ